MAQLANNVNFSNYFQNEECCDGGELLQVRSKLDPVMPQRRPCTYFEGICDIFLTDLQTFVGVFAVGVCVLGEGWHVSWVLDTKQDRVCFEFLTDYESLRGVELLVLELGYLMMCLLKQHRHLDDGCSDELLEFVVEVLLLLRWNYSNMIQSDLRLMRWWQLAPQKMKDQPYLMKLRH